MMSTKCQYRPTISTGVWYSGLKRPRSAITAMVSEDRDPDDHVQGVQARSSRSRARRRSARACPRRLRGGPRGVEALPGQEAAGVGAVAEAGSDLLVVLEVLHPEEDASPRRIVARMNPATCLRLPTAAEYTARAMVRLDAISTRVLAKPILQLRWWLPAEKAAGTRTGRSRTRRRGRRRRGSPGR